VIRRRSLLGALVAAAVAGQALPRQVLAATGKNAAPPLPWRNWSGSQECLPAARVAPASLAELQELIASGSGVVRPVGAGHSFSALVPTDG
jgi:hypothetical protein